MIDLILKDSPIKSELEYELAWSYPSVKVAQNLSI